jgi:hypothetical protein
MARPSNAQRVIQYILQSASESATGAQLASHIGWATKEQKDSWLDRLVEEGHIAKNENGRYIVAKARRGNK